MVAKNEEVLALRVNPAGNNPSQEIRKGKNKKISGSHGRYSKIEGKGFADFLDEEEEKDLNALINEILESGNAFSRSPSEKNLNDYKHKIKEFLRLVEKRLYTITELSSIENKKAKLYFIVDKINSELEEMSKRIFNSERATLYFASKVGEINGLLMDLYR